MDKSNWSLIFERPKNVEKRREEEKREEEEEEEKKKKKGRAKRYGTMNFCMDLWIFLYGTLYRFVWIHVCGLWVMGCKKPNPRMNSCMESRVWKARISMIFDFEYGIMCI